ncbi:hypothetical protein [Promicromonospora sp. MEB111]|uniref:hypothetical protein n=1 Tax=Promicromonospora sp. MEB111 TaxID=3040301 RepID=UPI00255085F9|nr:hypothetical protein [Promicromonospora sp. MEB111]
MADVVELGKITCPSGQLVLTDGGYLSLWSGDRRPEDVAARPGPAADMEIVGPDASAAARTFDRQPGTRLYDIPAQGIEEVTEAFAEHCKKAGLDAGLQVLPQQVPHRERVRHAIASGNHTFLNVGVPVIPVGGVSTSSSLLVTATAGDWGWTQIRIALSAAATAQTRVLGHLRVDHARLVIADADALSSWVHEDPIDGLADVVFWGRDQAQLAVELDAPRLTGPGDVGYGWVDLPFQDALNRALDLESRRRSSGQSMFNFDFRPHSHHWQVMAKVRADEHEAGTISVGGADIMMAMTSVGDGDFPVHLELDDAGTPTAIVVVIDTEA